MYVRAGRPAFIYNDHNILTDDSPIYPFTNFIILIHDWFNW